jgi:hypothetical protein
MPDTKLPMTLFKGTEKGYEGELLPDTILFDPENRRFSLVWRVQQRIQRTILDFSECWVGPPSPGMLHARRKNKRYIHKYAPPPPADEEAA